MKKQLLASALAVTAACFIGDATFAQKDDAQKNAWTLFRVSPPGAMATTPRLLPTKHGLHLAWADVPPRHLHIASFDPLKKQLGQARPAKFRVGSAWVEEVFGKAAGGGFLDGYDVRVLDLIEALDDGKKTPGEPSFLGVTRRFFLHTNGPLDLLSVKILPHEKPKEYELAELGNVVPDPDDFLRPVDRGGIGRDPPLHSCLLRRANTDGKSLYLAVSDLEQIWTTQSSDGGKTWAPHRHVRRDRFWCELVETPTELLMFCVTRKFELQMMRSKDGKTWTDPEPIFPDLRVGVPPSAKMDKDGAIWLAFGAGEAGKYSIQTTRSTDSGKIWSKPEPVTSGLNSDHSVSLVFHNDVPVIAFMRVTNAGVKDKETRAIWAAAKTPAR